MKVKELLKILVAEDLVIYLKTKNDNEIELEKINGANYDNLLNKQYFVDIDYETIENDETNECNLEAKYIIDFDLFNECEVVELNTERLWTELTIEL